MSHSSEEYYAIYDERRRKARKRTHCSACGGVIDKGQVYTRVFSVFDATAESLKRCARCQAIHEHLRAVGERVGVRDGVHFWPDERLACGIEYKEHWNVDPPAELAALAFWMPGDPIVPIPVPDGVSINDDYL